MVATLFQHYNAVLRWKSLLRMVSCNITLKRPRRERDNRELKQRRRRQQRERQQSTWFRLVKNNNFARASRFFYTFLCRRCRTTTWKCLISLFVEDVKTKQRLFSSFPELCSLLDLPPEKFVNIWRIERVGISAITFEVARIHFLSDVFVAVAVVVAEAP